MILIRLDQGLCINRMLHCTCRFLKLYIHGIHLSHWCDVIQIILGFHCETSLGAGARHCISDI